jgi:protein-S-isoprenylcysteine O-methyltransferase Ste14
MLVTVVWIAVMAFPASEVLLAIFKRAGADDTALADRGSLRLLWIVITLSVTAAVSLRFVHAGHFRAATTITDSVALSLVLAGLVLRWVAILTLGRLFTVNVAIHTGHALVDRGVYRYVRHPSYSGLLLAFLGLGVFYGSWLSILALVVPIALAILNRIRKEEAALLDALGEPYGEYCRRTRRLVPGVF